MAALAANEEEATMYAFMTGQWFQQRSRFDRPRLTALASAASLDEACCPRPRLQAEPGYPYSGDWRLRCGGCGRLRAPSAARREPIPALILAAFDDSDALRPAS